MAFDAETEERGLTLLTEMGDIELTWDSQHDEKMRALIEQKMREGVRFFVMKPLIGDAVHVRRKLKSMDDLKTQAVRVKDMMDLAVKVKDPEIERLVAEGQVRLSRSNAGPIDTVEAVTARDSEGKLDHAAASKKAVTQRTVGVRAMQGG